jgi:hypothetical protein
MDLASKKCASTFKESNVQYLDLLKFEVPIAVDCIQKKLGYDPLF